jgi:hypothetical protein
MWRMDDKIRAVLDRMPEKGRSKLEPHADVIRDLRRKGHTYEEIAQFFAERLNIKVAPSTIHAFVRVRARRHRQLRIELPADGSSASNLRFDRNDAEVRRRIEELKHRPEQDKTERPRFQYDEDKPLELIRDSKRS